jgi:hypothetical protein
MNFDVFISYPHQDKAVADAACAKLEGEGIRCWIAPRDVAPGADWAEAIVEAINRCRVMVIIFSSHANQSRQVHREVQQAFDHEKPVIPFRIESVVPEKALSYYMHSIHWLDALTPPLEDHLLKLAHTVRALSAGRPEGAATIAARPAGGAAGATATGAAPPREESARTAEAVALTRRIQAKNVVSTGLIFTFVSVFFTMLALFLIGAKNTGAALASFIAALPLVLLGFSFVGQPEKFRVAGAIALGLLLALILAVLVLPASIVSLNFDPNALALLGVFVAAAAAPLLWVEQPRTDSVAVYTLRAFNYFVKRRSYVFFMAIAYAFPTWIVYYGITQSLAWLASLIIAQALAAAAVIARHRQAVGPTGPAA